MNRLFSGSLLAVLLATQAQAADELDSLDQKQSVRAEHTFQVGGRALWTLPFETTQYLPAQPTPRMREALVAQQAGHFFEAIDLLEQPGEEANLSDTQLLRAGFYMEGQQYDQAREILAGVLQQQAQLSEAHALMAMAQLQQGQTEAAWDSVQKARSLGDSPLATRVASYVLQAQGKLAEASAAMAALNGKGRSDPLNLAREAELALSVGEVERASERAGEARKLAPDSPYVNAVSGLVWLIEDQPAQAQQAFEIALKRDPEDAKALLGLGLAKARQGRLAESVEQLRKAAGAEPSSAMIQTYLGRALRQSGHRQEAETAYRNAIRLDPQDPAPWIHLAQLQTEGGQPGAALASLNEAAARKAARGIYRGESLLREDEQILQANIADAYQRLGLDSLAWQALAEGAGEKNAQTLKNQAETLQGSRFAETARRSLALQSLFNDAPDALPVSLDVYGGGGGQAGANTPQHGAVSGLSGQRASYGDYAALFSQPEHVEADAVVGNRQTWGGQARAAAGGERLGLSVAERHYETDGFSSFNGLDNTTWQGVLKWDLLDKLRLFLSYEDFHSERGEVILPADPWFGSNASVDDKNKVARLGMRYRLTPESELRALFSHQNTDQNIDYETFPSLPPVFTFSQAGESRANSGELQYRRQDAGGLWLAGAQKYREHAVFFGVADRKLNAGQTYIARELRLDEQWMLDLALGRAWLENDDLLFGGNTELKRWTPRLGLSFAPAQTTHVRLALAQILGLNDVGGASLAPVETAGIVHVYPGDTNKLVRSAGLGFDHRLGSEWLLSGEAQARRTWQPVYSFLTSSQELSELRHGEAVLGVAWVPTRPYSVTLEAGYEKRSNPDYPNFSPLDSVERQALSYAKLSLNWFARPGLTLKSEVSRNRVDGNLAARDLFFTPFLQPYSDASTQLDASLQWKLPRGQIEFGVRNLLNDAFAYIESDPLLPRFGQGRLVYGSARLSW